MSSASPPSSPLFGAAEISSRPAMRFGLTWTGNPSSVSHAEDLGVDSLWAGGHITFRSPTREPLVRLAQLAVLSTRVTIGTSISILPLYPPAIVARQVADIDRDCGGRVIFGVGAGGDWPPEFEACQIPLNGRGPRMDESIDVLRAMWNGPVEHDGPLFPMRGVEIDAPAQPGGPPIVVAGRKLPAMRRAATRGDGWMPYLYSARRYAESVATISEIADEAGRMLTGFRWMAFVFVHAEPDGRRAHNTAARILSDRYGQDMTGMLDRVAVVGDPEGVAEQLTAYRAAGVDHVILAPIVAGDNRDFAEYLFDSVVPHLAPSRAHRAGPAKERGSSNV